MAYARPGDGDSQVYLWSDGELLRCEHLNNSSFNTRSRLIMLEHLNEHLRCGVGTGFAIERLHFEEGLYGDLLGPGCRMPATVQGKEFAVTLLTFRRRAYEGKPRVDNSALPSGSPMYFGCIGCGASIEVPENYTDCPRLCFECQALHDLGWLT